MITSEHSPPALDAHQPLIIHTKLSHITSLHATPTLCAHQTTHYTHKVISYQ